MLKKDVLDLVFKAYDIRGRVPDELDSEFFYYLGNAYVSLLHPNRLAIGNDIRPESYTFKKSLARGIRDAGCDVLDLGEISTEMLYGVVGAHSDTLDGGLVVTASHNPQGWNGCKLVGKHCAPIGKDTGLFDIKAEMLRLVDSPLKVANPGTLSDFYAYPEYKSKVLSFAPNLAKLPKLKVLVDAGNGIGGRVFDYIFGNLPRLDITPMYFVPDGSFPHHVPDPMKEENVAELKERVVSEGFDLGISIDGDADRVFFVDRKGRRPSGVYMGVLIGSHLVKQSENKRIVHDPRITWPFEKEAERIGAEVFTSKAGHSYFKAKLPEVDALFGAEASSHFFYKDFYNCDSAMITLAIVFDMFATGFDLTERLDYLYTTYPNSGEVNYTVESADAVLEAVETELSDIAKNVEHLDGLSMAFDNWRFNLRKSNTQPLVRLNVEGIDVPSVVEGFKRVEDIINAPRKNLPSLAELI